MHTEFHNRFKSVSIIRDNESASVGVGSGAIGACAAKAGMGKIALTGLALASVVATPLTAGLTIGLLAGIVHASNACRNRGRLPQ